MPLRATDDANPFVAFQRYLAWDSFAAANGMTEAARTAMIRQLDSEIADVTGTGLGFRSTPFDRADSLSDALGFTEDGGVWAYAGFARGFSAYSERRSADWITTPQCAP